MTIGFMGVHRSGKTTLAKIVAEEIEVPFHKAFVSDVFHKTTLLPSEEMEFSERLEIQNRILSAHIESWQSAETHFVTDRTPLCMLTYLMADVSPWYEYSVLEDIRVQEYARKCYEATNQFFSAIILLQPGIPIQNEIGKATAKATVPYMEMFNSLALGHLYDERCHTGKFFLRRGVTDLDQRVNASLVTLERFAEGHQKVLSMSEIH